VGVYRACACESRHLRAGRAGAHLCGFHHLSPNQSNHNPNRNHHPPPGPPLTPCSRPGPGATTDYLVLGSDSGKIVILEWVTDSNSWRKLQEETFGKTGCRRIAPGQYLAVDPKGRAVIIGAWDRCVGTPTPLPPTARRAPPTGHARCSNELAPGLQGWSGLSLGCTCLVAPLGPPRPPRGRTHHALGSHATSGDVHQLWANTHACARARSHALRPVARVLGVRVRSRHRPALRVGRLQRQLPPLPAPSLYALPANRSLPPSPTCVHAPPPSPVSSQRPSKSKSLCT
jgi:hypothetical protein